VCQEKKEETVRMEHQVYPEPQDPWDSLAFQANKDHQYV
jgi:hypothetical protein